MCLWSPRHTNIVICTASCSTGSPRLLPPALTSATALFDRIVQQAVLPLPDIALANLTPQPTIAGSTTIAGRFHHTGAALRCWRAKQHSSYVAAASSSLCISSSGCCAACTPAMPCVACHRYVRSNSSTGKHHGRWLFPTGICIHPAAAT